MRSHGLDLLILCKCLCVLVSLKFKSREREIDIQSISTKLILMSNIKTTQIYNIPTAVNALIESVRASHKYEAACQSLMDSAACFCFLNAFGEKLYVCAGGLTARDGSGSRFAGRESMWSACGSCSGWFGAVEPSET